MPRHDLLCLVLVGKSAIDEIIPDSTRGWGLSAEVWQAFRDTSTWRVMHVGYRVL